MSAVTVLKTWCSQVYEVLGPFVEQKALIARGPF